MRVRFTGSYASCDSSFRFAGGAGEEGLEAGGDGGRFGDSGADSLPRIWVGLCQ